LPAGLAGRITSGITSRPRSLIAISSSLIANRLAISSRFLFAATTGLGGFLGMGECGDQLDYLYGL